MGERVFVRKKVVKGKHYFQLVQNNRAAGRVRQTILASLGQWPTVTAAREAIPQSIQELDQLMATKREEQSQADSHRPWPRYARPAQTNWKLVHQRASQEIRRLRREITRLSNLLEDIHELERGVIQ
jgi:hypothetical protein